VLKRVTNEGDPTVFPELFYKILLIVAGFAGIVYLAIQIAKMFRPFDFDCDTPALVKTEDVADPVDFPKAPIFAAAAGFRVVEAHGLLVPRERPRDKQPLEDLALDRVFTSYLLAAADHDLVLVDAEDLKYKEVLTAMQESNALLGKYGTTSFLH